MRVKLTEQQFKEYVKYQILKETQLNEDWRSNLKGAALGLGLGAMTMGGLQSCQKGYNEPDFPRTEVSAKEYQPHYYSVGDKLGESAKTFKSFYDSCDWSKCGPDDGYVYSFTSGGCGKEDKSRAWWVNVVKKDKKDGYYSYLMYLPADKFQNRIQVGDIISGEYLKNNTQLQTIFTVNCITPDGEIQVNTNSNTNCQFNGATKFFNQFNDWEIGMKRVVDKWIGKDKKYHFELMECVALEGKTYKIIPDVVVNEDVYMKYNKGDIVK